MFAASAKRVPAHTEAEINRRVEIETEMRLRYYQEHPEEVAARLVELDHEWDVERVLQANAATFALTGTLLAVVRDRRWLVLPVAVTGFLLQHALQGWCPPLPALRRLGFRTAREIERERYALKAMRGEFDAGGEGRTAAILRALGLRGPTV